MSSVCGLSLCILVVLIGDLVQRRLLLHFKQTLGILEIVPFPEKKPAKNKTKAKPSKNAERKFCNIWCSTSYDQLHFILTSQAHSISHFFKQHFHKTISQKCLNIKISKIKPTRGKKHRNYFFTCFKSDPFKFLFILQKTAPFSTLLSPNPKVSAQTD